MDRLMRWAWNSPWTYAVLWLATIVSLSVADIKTYSLGWFMSIFLGAIFVAGFLSRGRERWAKKN